MTITIDYQFVNLDDNPDLPIPFPILDFGAATGSVDIIGLANGGLAGIGNAGGTITGTIFNSVGQQTGSWTNTAGTNGSIDQLDNGNLVIASQDADSIRFKVVDGTTGAEAVPSTDLNLPNSRNADVVALSGGGFAIAYENTFAPGDNDINVAYRTSAGGFVTAFALDITTANDTGVAVTQLDNGNVAFAWTRTIGAATEVWYAIRDTNGLPVRGPTLLDNTGTVNRNVTIASIADLGGGFSVAYEDNQYDPGKVDITIATLNVNGNIFGSFNLADSAPNARPSLSRLPNGLLALSYSQEQTDTDSFVALVDPINSQVLARRDLITTSISNDNENSVIAGFGAGYILTADDDLTGGDTRGQVLMVQRTTQGHVGQSNVLSGDDFIDVMTGGFDLDTLSGGGGNDTLDGGANRDTVNGGAGNDLVQGNAGQDTLNGEDGNDFIFSNTLDDPTSGEGGALNGGAGSDALTGAGGIDFLDGGSGADNMAGGGNGDVYTVDNAGDTLVEAADQGTDRVFTSVTYTLAAELEQLTLTGLAAINGTGNALGNFMTGNAAANLLDGAGGVDIMIGGGGNDTYVVGTAGEVTSETGGGGIDTVRASVTFGLGVDLENLTLIGASPINGNGNGLNNRLTGNGAANILNGQAGADTMFGLGGNDTYVVDSTLDRVLEAAGGGIDLVQSTVGYSLGAEQDNLTLLGGGAVNGGGNALNNRLTGNGAANILIGLAGADTMTGLGGNDNYVVDSTLDRVVEAASGGTDLVQSSVSFSLGTGQENLTLLGAGAINGGGNALANRLTGNGAANILFGFGGNDTMDGGLGADRFIFNTALNAATNVDTLQAYSVAADRIDLDDAVFAGLAPGGLAQAAFTIGAAATTAAHRIIYNSATGALIHDSDGSGANAATQFATLAPGLAMTNAEFFVF